MSSFEIPQPRNCAAVLAGALLLASCGPGNPDPRSSTAAPLPPRPFEQSDLQIAAMIYQGEPRTPAGFYVEAVPSGYRNVATAHLKNSDLDASIDADRPEFELCANDWSEALAWSEASARTAARYSNLVTTNDATRFFEFGRVHLSDPQLYLRSRVYKCAYLNRTGVDLRAPAGAAGQLNVRPLTAADLRGLSEYLWQFTIYNNFGHVVLNSVETASARLQHTLHIASLVRGGIAPTCDRIDIIAWRHTLDTASGAITLGTQTLWSFGARESGGAVELCGQ